jgi:hypothetical protein
MNTLPGTSRNRMRLSLPLLFTAAIVFAACNPSISTPPDSGPVQPYDAGPTVDAGPTDAGPIDAGSDAGIDAGTDAGTDAGECDLAGDGGCYPCAPTTTTQFLNQCSGAQCSGFSNTARIPSNDFLSDGGLPPLN